MKRHFCTKTLVALAVAVAVASAAVSQTQGQPSPSPATDTALPASVVPGSPLADVIKMIQAGVDPSTVKTYIGNVQNPFNLDADTIIYLKDLGAPSDIINAMMDRDKALYASTVTPPSQPTAPPVDTTPDNTAPPPDGTPDTAPPPTEVTVNYFNDTLTPYGTWVDAEGYGRCWRPTVAIYNSGWSPYCDGGHWVYTDYGWYWDSDYSWGTTFHYGRWFRSPRLGWCWYPDTVWAPSWVVWRSSDDYCGWAPLPPFAVFHPGVGFFYRGFGVSADFDFGLAADCFVFIPPGHFCDWHPRSYFVDRDQVGEVFRRTTVINNYSANKTTIVNGGIRPERIASVTHRPIEPVRVGSLPNAGRQGWRGEGYERTMHPTPGNRNSGTGVPPVRSNPPGNNNPGHNSPGHNFSTGNGGNGVGNDQFRHGPQAYNNPGVPGSQQPRQTGPQTYIHQQPAQPPQPSARQNNAYAESSHVVPQNQWQQNQLPQNRSAGTAVPDYSQQHGAAQLQQRESVPPEQPRQEPPPNYGQPQGQYHQPPAQPAPQGQPQPRNAGNGNSNGGSNRQNQNH